MGERKALNDPTACERHLALLREQFPALGVEAFLVRDTSNIQWLLAFDAVFDEEMAHALYVDEQRALLHTDSRYVTACERAAEGKPLAVNADRETHAKIAARLWNERSVDEAAGRLGIEDAISLGEYRRLEKTFSSCHPERSASGAAPCHPERSAPSAAPCHPERSAEREVEGSRGDSPHPFAETDGVVVNLRAVKDPYEIARMRAAQAITDAAFAHIVGFMRPGLTEREVQLELEEFMLRHGAEGLAFPSIVATGANGASPHAIPGATLLEAGQCVVLDFGARAYGYCSDMTRTVFLGEPLGEMRAAWDTLRKANEAVEAMLAPGVTGKEAHELAEKVLADGGFAGRMGHGLGHGVGIDIHEEPVLSLRNDKPLAPGNVVTVEPGIYLPGQFGMRLEDFGVITDDGFDVFTRSTHEMVVL